MTEYARLIWSVLAGASWASAIVCLSRYANSDHILFDYNLWIGSACVGLYTASIIRLAK